MSIVAASAAHAEWLHKTEENPFDGDGHIALAISDVSGYGLGFRCTNADDLSLVFLTNEILDPEVTSEKLAVIAVAGVTKLKIIVDDAAKVEFNAAPERTSSTGGTLRFVAMDEGLESLIKAVKSAKRRVAVAASLGGKNYHPKVFDVRGSRKALEELESGCKLSKDTAD